MPIHNADISEMFDRVADMLEILDENPFRVRAYRTAARTVGSLPQSIAVMVEEEKDLTVLPGIGKDLAAKIGEMVKTGTFSRLQELEDRVPPQLIRLMKIPGLGPKAHSAIEEMTKVFAGLRESAAALPACEAMKTILAAGG